MNELFGELVLGPPCLQRCFPGGVVDVSYIGRGLADHGEERGEFVVEIDVPARVRASNVPCLAIAAAIPEYAASTTGEWAISP